MGGLDNGHSDLAPVPGATIYFIKDQQIVNQSTTNAVGFYSVIITPGEYSVVTVAQGMQTLMTEETFQGTRTLDRQLMAIPYSGIVPYAVNPVVETSPGRPVSVTIAVENSQLGDQYLTFTEQTPSADWVAWPADGDGNGDMLGLRSGDKGEISFMFQYNGNQHGAAVMYVLVSGGPFYAKIPVVIVVKDMPYESMDLYSNEPQRTIKAGTMVNFTFNVNNKYSRDEPLTLDIQKPDGWGASTGKGTEFYVADDEQASSDLWVYAPADAAPGFYTVNLTLKGQDVSSNTLHLQIQVVGIPAYDALIRGYSESSDGYPNINLSEGDTFDLPVHVYNNGEFPLDITATAEVGDNWAYYLDGAPWDKITIAPNRLRRIHRQGKSAQRHSGQLHRKNISRGQGPDGHRPAIYAHGRAPRAAAQRAYL